MSSHAETPELIAVPEVHHSPGFSARIDVPELIAMSLRGLRPMFNSLRQRFCYTLVQRPVGMTQEGLSPRYTVMTLLGLIEVEKAGGVSPFNIDLILDSMLQDTSWPRSAGDFGLLAWLTAVRMPNKLPGLFARFKLETAFQEYDDLRRGLTMEMAWLLTGLCYAQLAGQPGIPDLTALAQQTYRALLANQGKGGFFGHLSRNKTTAGRFRGWLGSFADQVYPTIAFTRYSQAFRSSEALDRALQCGTGICRVQGPLGQWWWHYDSRTGKVASMYPVFSVHQEAMGPMALFPLVEATGRDFRENIYRGLQWIGTANELGQEMRDFSNNLVWRRMHPLPQFSMKMDVMLAQLHIYRDASKRPMGVLHECRPYELGWLLYAFAGRAHETQPANI
ncbi:MAG: hypothetical protein NVS9B4_19540 [Candidatus Acidiferrum sp.]